MNENIIDKIQKLLKLSEGNENPNEAAAAAAAAQKLMLKYNISTLMIDSISNFENINFKSLIKHIHIPIQDKWEASLAQEISESSDVYIVGLTNQNYEICTIKVFGKEESILVFEATFEFLKSELVKILNKKYLSVSTKSQDWCNTFYFAAVAAIGERLQKEKLKSMEEIESSLKLASSKAGVSIVHVSNAISKLESVRQEIEKLVDGPMEEFNPKDQDFDQDAAIKGYREGSMMNLRRTSLDSGNKLKGE